MISQRIHSRHIGRLVRVLCFAPAKLSSRRFRNENYDSNGGIRVRDGSLGYGAGASCRSLDRNLEGQPRQIHLQPWAGAEDGRDCQIQSAPNGIKTTIDGADAKGQPTHTESVSTLDGKDTPVDGAPALNTTTALKRIDGRTFEAQGKVGGKPTVTTRVVVSADGKTMTATQTGQDIKGQAIENVIVLEKQ